MSASIYGPAMRALSIKQPWATLLVHGLKTIEVRCWPTKRQERILIHAAKATDERPEGWALVPPELHDAAQLRGGIVGAGDLTGCKVYRNRAQFLADQSAHRNPPSWFEESGLYGFTFTNLAVTPFHPCPGWMRFFPVDDVSTEAPVLRLGQTGEALGPALALSGLLVSVRSVEEVEDALAGGVAIVDVKEPGKGALGQAPDETIRAIVGKVAGRRPVSAALGELLEGNLPPTRAPLGYVKWGLAGCGSRGDWRGQWCAMALRLQQLAPGCRAVAVAYADWERAQAPPPEEVAAFACGNHCTAFMIDTWQKDGTTLLDWMTPEEAGGLVARCRDAGLATALAGSLGARQILALRPTQPDFFAVRGAACPEGKRDSRIDAGAVRFLADLVAGLTPPAARRGS